MIKILALKYKGPKISQPKTESMMLLCRLLEREAKMEILNKTVFSLKTGGIERALFASITFLFAIIKYFRYKGNINTHCENRYIYLAIKEINIYSLTLSVNSFLLSMNIRDDCI